MSSSSSVAARTWRATACPAVWRGKITHHTLEEQPSRGIPRPCSHVSKPVEERKCRRVNLPVCLMRQRHKGEGASAGTAVHDALALVSNDVCVEIRQEWCCSWPQDYLLVPVSWQVCDLDLASLTYVRRLSKRKSGS